MTKQIHIDKEILRDLFYMRKFSKIDGWELITNEYDWDGGDERTRTTIVKNLTDGYHLEITNYYNSWDEDWDPMIRVVEPKLVTVQKIIYNTVEGVELV